MGKRKRTCSDNNSNKTTPPSDVIHNAPQMDLQLERRSHQAETGSLKTPPSDQSPLNSSMLLRHPRYSFGLQCSRRSSMNHSDPYDANLSFKLGNKDTPEFPNRERWGRSFHKPERIRSTSLALNAVSPNVREMECGICHKRIRKNPLDNSVVAILVCGHAYHADCLEHKTSNENKWDPLCPFLCKRDTM